MSIRAEMFNDIALNRTRRQQGGLVTDSAKIFAHAFAHILPTDLIVWLVIVTFEILMRRGMTKYFQPIAKDRNELRQWLGAMLNNIADEDEKLIKYLEN